MSSSPLRLDEREPSRSFPSHRWWDLFLTHSSLWQEEVIAAKEAQEKCVASVVAQEQEHAVSTCEDAFDHRRKVSIVPSHSHSSSVVHNP